MIRSISKITIVLLLIVALPISVYLVREFSAMSNNERMVERVFATQLQSVLYSVNQYSENVIKQWEQSLNQPIESNNPLMQPLIDDLLLNNPAIKTIRFLNIDRPNVLAQYSRPEETINIQQWPAPGQIQRLRNFLENNYFRTEAELVDGKILYSFLPRNKEGKQLCQILVNPDVFVSQNLSSQIQQISQDIFYIRIQDKNAGKLVYQTGELSGPKDSVQVASLWYMPGYDLGIRLKSKTITQLASERTQRDNYLLAGMSLLVLFGFLFVVVNVRKEMKLAELKSEFVSNVSHEIRTPLSLISMYTETLLMNRVKTEEKKEEYLRTIHQESTRLTGIVNRILNFSRVEKNKQTYHFEVIDLNKLIADIIHSLDARLESAQVDYQFQSATDVLHVKVDRESVKDMLVNLVDNAIKYGAETGKTLNVRLLKKGKQAWIEVKDNGIGISAKNQKYIFDQFYRVTEGDLAHKAKGSGLGLNLVKRMMKAHRGKVSVTSKLGEGSTFTLKFPIKNKNDV